MTTTICVVVVGKHVSFRTRNTGMLSNKRKLPMYMYTCMYMYLMNLLFVNVTCTSLYTVGNITSNFPNIKYLSMMKNAAAPSYFNGGSKQEYQDYR